MTASDKLVTAQLIPGDRILVGSYTEQVRTRDAELLGRPVGAALFVAPRKRSNAEVVIRTATVVGMDSSTATYASNTANVGPRARRTYTVHTDLGDLTASPAQTHLKG